jgi:hypothetical protein
MKYTRRDFGKFALGSIPVASAILANPRFIGAQAKPNSKINGVQIGVISYSFRSMPDQSAEATLQYVVDSGINAIELMNGPVWDYAQKKTGFTPPNAGRGGGGGRGPGGPGGAGGGRGPGAGAPGAPAPAAEASTGSFDGQPCPAGRGGGAPGGGGRGRGQQTPEQIAAQQAAADETRKWQQGLSMDLFKDLRKMYNDAGVTMYAVKILEVNGTDEDLDFQFTVGKTLGATHLTTELPAHSDTSAATLKRAGDIALKHGMFAAYHTHLQGRMDAFDEAFAASQGNKANIDFGHYVAAGEVGGTPMDFLTKFHDRVASFHLKDRTLPEHCSLNLAWGKGDTPIKQILQLVQKNKWPLPATIELEYQIPEGSDAVKEVRKCVDYCRAALA